MLQALSMPTRWVLSLLLAMVAALSGCAQSVVLDAPESSTENFQRAKAAGMRPVAVADITSEAQPSEARYLKDTLVVELQSAGMIDPAADVVIRGRLVDVRMGRRQGSVAAHFSIAQADGRVIYDRELRASSNWTAGADVAKEQSAVYRKLIGVLFNDPSFKNAVAR